MNEPTMKEIAEWLVEGGVEAANVILLRGGDSQTADEEQAKWEARAAQVEAMGERRCGTCGPTTALKTNNSENLRGCEMSKSVSNMFSRREHMDMLQAIINGMSAHDQQIRAVSEQLTLGEFIKLLKTMPSDFVVKGLGELDSYRDYYCDLAFSPELGREETVERLLARCKAAMGEVFTGYKGGDYVMGAITPLWVSEYGDCTGDMLIGINQDGTIIVKNEYED